MVFEDHVYDWGRFQKTGLHTRTKITSKLPLVKYIYWPFQGGTSFVLFFPSCVWYTFARLLINALWSPAGKGLTSCFSFLMSNCVFVTFPCGILGQVWYLILSHIDFPWWDGGEPLIFNPSFYSQFFQENSTILLVFVRFWWNFHWMVSLT